MVKERQLCLSFTINIKARFRNDNSWFNIIFFGGESYYGKAFRVFILPISNRYSPLLFRREDKLIDCKDVNTFFADKACVAFLEFSYLLGISNYSSYSHCPITRCLGVVEYCIRSTRMGAILWGSALRYYFFTYCYIYYCPNCLNDDQDFFCLEA